MGENTEAQGVAPAVDTKNPNKPRMTRREFFNASKEVAKGLVAGASFSWLGKILIPTLHSGVAELKAFAETGRELIDKKEGLTLEEKVEETQREIKTIYGINVEFQETAIAFNKAFLLKKLKEVLVIYPPQLFQNLAAISEQKAGIGLDLDIVVPDEGIPMVDFPPKALEEKGWTVRFKNLPFLVAGYGGEEGIEIDKAKAHTMPFPELFSHELGHAIHFLFGTPSLSSFSEELSAYLSYDPPSPEKFVSFIKNFPQRLLLPGFISYYSRFNMHEDTAETFAFLLNNPKKALEILEDREYRGELKLKLIAAIDMLYCSSGGLMDKQYYYDLAQGRVNGEYWGTKQSEPYTFGKTDDSTVLFITDIDKSPRERLPTLIELTEVQKKEKPLTPFREYNLGTLEGRSVAVKKRDDPELGSWVDLVVNDIPLNFLAPAEGRRIRVKLQTFSEQISFEIENKGGLFLIGGAEKEMTGNVSEKVLKIISLPAKISKALGFVVLGAQALELVDEAMYSHLHPLRSKKLALKTLLTDNMTRRDFLRRVAAATALAGITYYLSF